MSNQAFDLSRKPMSGFQILIVALCFIINFNDGIDVLIVSYSSSEIIKEFGLTNAQMGYIFSMGLAGMTLGCVSIAPLADRFGRRMIFLISISAIGIGMFGIWLSHDYASILTLRFLTGLGIGGVLPSLTATTAEFCNEKYKDFNVGLIQGGWPVGAILTGFFCNKIIPQYGWHKVFFFAGCFSIIMLLLVFFYMTDSLEYMVKNPKPNSLGKVNRLLRRMDLPLLDRLPAWEGVQELRSVKTLFDAHYKAATIKLWVSAFFGFMTLYTMMSWVPNIAKSSGMGFSTATYVGIFLNLGAALGSASIGALGARFGFRQAVLSFLVSGCIAMQLYSNFSLEIGLAFFLILLIGIFIQGGFNGIWPILSRIYPAEIRATGVGFTMGIGRLGAILGPSLFGLMADHAFSMHSLFIIFSIPPLIMAAGIWSIKSSNL